MVQALGAAAQHYPAFCNKDKHKTKLSSACSFAQPDKNVNLEDECFSGHCITGQYEQAVIARALVPLPKLHVIRYGCASLRAQTT